MCLAALPVALQAQEQKKDTTLVRTVVVEQEYNPDIMDAAKVNVLPHVEPPAVSKKAVAYDEKLMPATRIPAGLMQPYSGQEAQEKATAGYARLGYGNNNNLDLQAAYRFALTDQDRLNLQLGMDGMNGKLDMGEGQEKWKSRYYRTRAAESSALEQVFQCVHQRYKRRSVTQVFEMFDQLFGRHVLL